MDREPRRLGPAQTRRRCRSSCLGAGPIVSPADRHPYGDGFPHADRHPHCGREKGLPAAGVEWFVSRSAGAADEDARQHSYRDCNRDRTATATAAPSNDGINGRVTYQGAAASGIELQLRFYDGSETTTLATTTTDSAGHYRFMGAASLGSGQEYWVRFRSPNNPLWVAFWLTPSITAYTSGSTMAGGDFDIANVSLLSPPAGAAEALPVTFTWQQRGIAGDTYRIVFTDLDTDAYWYTPDLGNVGSFTATSLWGDAVFGKPYGWLIWVFDGPDSYGQSYFYQSVSFLSGMAVSPAALEEWQIGEEFREPGLMGPH